MMRVSLGRLVLYREKSEAEPVWGFLATTPIEMARVVEYRPWNGTYLIQPLRLNAEPLVIDERQVVEDGYLTPWPPPGGDRKQVAEGLASRMEVLGKECAVLAEKLRRNAT